MKNLLVSMLVNVGDVIMMTSVLDLIKKERPGLALTALVRPEAAELLRDSPCVDGLIVYPYRSGSFFHGLGDVLKAIRRAGCDAFLSLDRRPRGAIAAALAGLAERLGPDMLYESCKPEFWTRWLFTKRVGLSLGERRGCQVEMFQLVARRALGLAGHGRITLPPVSREKKAWAAELLAPAKGPVVGLCVRANDAAKTWPAERYVALMKRLHDEYHAFMYVTGGPNDAGYVDDLLSGAPPALNLAGQTGLMDVVALAAQSALCITPDNGAAHLMAVAAPKMLCLLSATTPEKVATSLHQATFLTDADVGQAFRAAAELLGPPC